MHLVNSSFSSATDSSTLGIYMDRHSYGSSNQYTVINPSVSGNRLFQAESGEIVLIPKGRAEVAGEKLLKPLAKAVHSLGSAILRHIPAPSFSGLWKVCARIDAALSFPLAEAASVSDNPQTKRDELNKQLEEAKKTEQEAQTKWTKVRQELKAAEKSFEEQETLCKSFEMQLAAVHNSARSKEQIEEIDRLWLSSDDVSEEDRKYAENLKYPNAAYFPELMQKLTSSRQQWEAKKAERTNLRQRVKDLSNSKKALAQKIKSLELELQKLDTSSAKSEL